MNRHVAVHSRDTLFQSGTLGYHTFRIPAVVALGNGVVLVAAEGRRDALRDWGQIDVLVRRSADGGKTFGPPQPVLHDPGHTSGNPTFLFDQYTNTLALSFCKNKADQSEQLVLEGKAERTVWLCTSHDAGLSFSKPREITAQVKRDNWTWYATGPGHGVTLKSGRWVIPCCHVVGLTTTANDPAYSHLIMSDDQGATWHVGARSDVARSSECAVVEVKPNEVYVDFRYDQAPHTRGGAYSRDAGETFEWQTLHTALVDPGCRGGVATGALPGEIWLTHARGPTRKELVLERSVDGGHNFTQAALLVPGRAAYSDLVYIDGRLFCAVEVGEDSPYERIEWLEIAGV